MKNYPQLNSAFTKFCVAILLLLLTNLFMVSGKINCPEMIPVVDYFQSIEEKYDVKFSYSISLWQDMKICPRYDFEHVQQAIDKLNTDLPLTVKQANEKVYIVVPVRSEVKLKLVDEKDSEIVPLVYIMINKEKRNLYFTNGQYFDIDNVLPTDELFIEASFYKPITISASDLFNGQNELILKNKVFQVDEVVVIPAFMTRGIDSRLSDLGVGIDIQELSSIAGETDGDVYQVLKAIPGINSPTGKPGSIIIRGNLFDLNLIQFDNIPIYHTGHLYGAFSPFNPAVVRNVNVFRNSVPIEYGGKVGGMVDIKTRSDVIDSLEGSVLSNLVYSGFNISAPLKKEKLGVLLSARSTMPFLKQSPKFKAISDLSNQGSIVSPIIANKSGNEVDIDENFFDINAKIIYKPSDNNLFSLSSIFINNYIDIYADLHDPAIERYQISDFYNHGITALWETKWSDKINSKITTTTSRFFFVDNVKQTMLNDSAIKKSSFSINDIKLNASADYIFNSDNKLTAGYSFVNHNVYNYRKYSHKFIPVIDSSATGNIHSMYLKYEKIFWSKLISSAGIRGNYFNRTKNIVPDVHLNLTYQLNNHLFFKGSASQMNQYISNYVQDDFEDYLSFKQIWILADKPEQIIVGKQIMLGAIYKKQRWLIDLEVYDKKISGLVKPTFSSVVTPPPLTNNTPNQSIDNRPPLLVEGEFDEFDLVTLRSKGIDFLMKKKWNQIDTWISYTLSHTFTDEDSIRSVYFDRRHELNVTAIIPVNKWIFSMNWNYGTGLPVLIYEYKGNPADIDKVEISYKERYPAIHQLDISVTYKFLAKKDKVDGVIGFSALNVYNKNNIVNNYRHIENYHEVFRYGIGFAPNIQVELTF